MLAAAYDALKAVDGRIRSPESGSRRAATTGRTHRATSRLARPLPAGARQLVPRERPDDAGDGRAQLPPVPERQHRSLSNGYAWPSIGLVNADRLKQAIHDAFGGTSHPTVGSGLKLFYDELGWQVDTSGHASYSGSENVPVTIEANQAEIYGQIPRLVACDPAISAVNLFGFVDAGDLAGFQAGLVRKDGTPRASLNTFRDGVAAGCRGGG